MKTTKRRVIGRCIIYGILFFPIGLFSAMMTAFMFDAPGSTEMFFPNFLALTVLSLPLSLLLSIILQWRAYRRQDEKALNKAKKIPYYVFLFIIAVMICMSIYENLTILFTEAS